MPVTVVYSTRAVAEGGRSGRVRSLDGPFETELSTPRDLGGEGGAGATPEQLFAAGFAASFLGAMKAAATADGMPKVPADGAVTAEVGLGPNGLGGLAMTAELSIHLPGLDPEAAERLIRAARDLCPFSAAVRGNINVRLRRL